MGWEIMGTEHLKPKAATRPTNQEQAERVIDFLENSGYPLLPWQAEALRALLTYPVATRFMVGAPRQHPPDAKKPCPCLALEVKLTPDWHCGSCGALHKAGA